ncbi:hypothetical protein N7524_011874 [Penicillium chrysogenum]|nr:hypothetical protein N7524_011874 [Penicillium chrysogenum]
MPPKPRGGKRMSCNVCRQKKRKCDLSSGLGERKEPCSSPNDTGTCKRQRLEHTTPDTSPGESLVSDERTQSSTLLRPQFNGISTTVALRTDPGTVMEGRFSFPPSSPRDTAASSPLDDGLRTPFAAKSLELNTEGSFLLQNNFLGDPPLRSPVQIDGCVVQFGLEDGNAFHAEIIAAKCLEVVLEALNLAESIKEQHPGDTDSKEKPLIDCAPSILRTICADLCCWVCSRGKRPLESYEPSCPGLRSVSPGEALRVSSEDFQIQRKADYVAIANRLRDSVAAASSHRETGQMVASMV